MAKSIDLIGAALLHETKFPMVKSVAIAASVTTDKRKVHAAVTSRPLVKINFTGFKKGFYAVPEEAQATIGGSTIYAGWFYGKPYVKVDGVKVPKGTEQWRKAVNAVTHGVATPTEAPARTTAVADDVIAL